MSNHSGHVKFSEGTHLDPESVHVECHDDSKYQLPEAHMGMLKIHHTYHAEFPVTHKLGSNVQVSVPNYNLYVRILEFSPADEEEVDQPGVDKIMVKVQIKTIKEGRIREKIIVSSLDDEKQQMEVLVTAQVMGSNQGNPILKDGVHLISHEVEDESEWPGHSSH